MTNSELIDIAIAAMSKAYVPYSGFRVGAALLTDDGAVYTGCNIENASFTPTVCAERVAFFEAVRDGHRKFSKLAVVGGKGGAVEAFTYPCGVCRQVMREFCTDDFVLVFTDGDSITEHKLCEIMPFSFTSEDLN